MIKQSKCLSCGFVFYIIQIKILRCTKDSHCKSSKNYRRILMFLLQHILTCVTQKLKEECCNDRSMEYVLILYEQNMCEVLNMGSTYIRMYGWLSKFLATHFESHFQDTLVIYLQNIQLLI